MFFFFFFKQKTAYEMRISDWSSDVCSSDLLVIEEFGFPRDGETYAPGTSTTWRDRFYAMIQNRVEASWRAGGPIAGSNFWAWNGEARAAHGDHRFREDRKGLVLGKSGALRVDLGGRRIV